VGPVHSLLRLAGLRIGIGQRYLEEHPSATIQDAVLVASCLVALPGDSFQQAVQTLRAMAETATSRRRARGVA